MEHSKHVHDLNLLKFKLSVLKNKISLAQSFLKQVNEEVYFLQEAIFDEEDRAMDNIKIYSNQL
jgi:hypothetical protein